jgi:hypothetical protein
MFVERDNRCDRNETELKARARERLRPKQQNDKRARSDQSQRNGFASEDDPEDHEQRRDA